MYRRNYRQECTKYEISRHSPYKRDYRNVSHQQENNTLEPSHKFEHYEPRRPLTSVSNCSIKTSDELEKNHHILEPKCTELSRIDEQTTFTQTHNQKKYTAKDALISTKIGHIENYQNKIDDLLSIVRSTTLNKPHRMKSVEKNPFKKQTPRLEVQCKQKKSLLTSENNQMRKYSDRPKSVMNQQSSKREKSIQISEFKPSQGSKDNYKDELLYRRLEKQSIKHKRNRSKQFMKNIQGEVIEIRNTVKKVNQKVKETDYSLNLTKQVDFDQLSSNPQSQLQEEFQIQRQQFVAHPSTNYFKKQFSGASRHRVPSRNQMKAQNSSQDYIVGDRNQHAEQMSRFDRYKLKKNQQQLERITKDSFQNIQNTTLYLKETQHLRNGPSQTQSSPYKRDLSPISRNIRSNHKVVDNKVKKSAGQIYKQQK